MNNRKEKKESKMLKIKAGTYKGSVCRKTNTEKLENNLVEVFLPKEEILIVLPETHLDQPVKVYKAKSRRDFYINMEKMSTSRNDFIATFEYFIEQGKIIVPDREKFMELLNDLTKDNKEIIQEFHALTKDEESGVKFTLDANHRHIKPQKYQNNKRKPFKRRNHNKQKML